MDMYVNHRKEFGYMGIFLNNKSCCADYQETVSDLYFVDKSMLIKDLFPVLGTKNRFLCITRPRRFGKSVMANMVGAFFGKSVDSGRLFDSLAIAGQKNYLDHLNRHNVIYIDFSRMPENCGSYQSYIRRIQNGLKEDLIQEYPDIALDPAKAVWDNLQMIFEKNGQRFIFVMDEWDAIFHKSFIQEADKEKYLEFLRNLLKDQVYVELAYMTGVLPIAKYSSGSELNMFLEYDMVTKKKFSGYFGFLDSEVDALYGIYAQETEHPEITREDLSIWYDGYCTAAGKRLYNPRSVVCALADNALSNYWTSSGPYDEIFYYIRNNIEDVREDLALMCAGERVHVKLQGYAATETELDTKNQIYSAMVVYGLLTCEDGAVFIPNKELMDKYNELLLTNGRLGYIHQLAKESEKMLAATLSGDTKTMAAILKSAHDTESPILSYNSEIELSAVVNLVYLAARDRYRVEREDKAGEGFVDFIFYPERRSDAGILLELKVDSTPQEALRQIRDKNYILRFSGKMGELPKYKGRILAVGISYDRKTKAHSCKIEVLREALPLPDVKTTAV